MLAFYKKTGLVPATIRSAVTKSFLFLGGWGRERERERERERRRVGL